MRSKTAGFCSSAIGINFCSAPLCSVGLGSNWPLEPARLRWGARNSRSNSLGSAGALDIARPGCSKTLHLSTFPASSQLGSGRALEMAARASFGFAGALEITARTRSAPPGRSNLLGLAARKHRTCQRFQLRVRSAPLGCRNGRSSQLGFAGALETAARTRSAATRRSKLLGLAA